MEGASPGTFCLPWRLKPAPICRGPPAAQPSARRPRTTRDPSVSGLMVPAAWLLSAPGSDVCLMKACGAANMTQNLRKRSAGAAGTVGGAAAAHGRRSPVTVGPGPQAPRQARVTG